MDRLKEVHTAEIARLKEEHQAEIARLHEVYSDQIARLDTCRLRLVPFLRRAWRLLPPDCRRWLVNTVRAQWDAAQASSPESSRRRSALLLARFLPDVLRNRLRRL